MDRRVYRGWHMATLTTTDDHLELRLTPFEKLAALHGDVHVPLSAVREVALEPDALSAPRGLRAPGLAIPGRVKIGTWRGRGHRMLVVVRRDQPAVRVRLEGAGPDQLVVGSADAAALVERLRAATGRGD